MKLNKIIMVGVFIAIMVIGISVCVNAETYSGYCGDHVTWSLDTSTGILNISGTGSMATDSYVPWSSYVSSVKYAIISEGVTSIGQNAFGNCSNLLATSIPNGITSIGYGAFASTGLTSITIPDSVTSIGDFAFYRCTSLTSITVDENNNSYMSQNGILFDKDMKTLIQYPIGKNFISYEIPNSVTSISSYAFYSCTNLTSVTIPDSVTSIGKYAFYDTAYYNDLSNWENDVLYIGNHLIKAQDTITGAYYGAYEIKEGTKTIADYAFHDCTGIASITIPDSVTSISNYAFSGCIGLTSINIPNSITSIGDFAFYRCTSLTSIDIPDSVTSIGDYAFDRCGSLTSIDIPDSVTSIGDWAFSGCTGLTSITIPDSVTSISNYAFSGCTGLTNITIPDSVTSIGSYAFYDCTGLTSITIPDSVTSIGNYAFYQCYSLKTVYYYGDKEAWEKITIGSDNEKLTKANIIYVTSHTLTASATGGKIQHNEADFTSCEINGSTLMTLTFIPDEGYELASVKLNGAEMIVLINNNQLIIGGYEEDVHIEATFTKIPGVPPSAEISTTNSGFYPTLVSAESGEVPTTVYALHNSVVCYVSGFKGTADFTLTGWGISIKSVDKGVTITLPADISNGVSADGKFAVRVFGQAMESGNYELSTYVTYENENGEEITDISEVKTVAIN